MSGRIAILLRCLEGGGMQRNAACLARGFLNAGHEVDILAADVGGVMRGQLPSGVRVRALPLASRALAARAFAEQAPGLNRADRLGLLLGPVPRLFRALPALTAVLRTTPLRALLALGTQANLVALAARRQARARLRVVVSEHNPLSAVVAHSRRRFRRLYPQLVRANYPQADAIVAVSQAIARDLVDSGHLPPERIQVLPNPVDVRAIRRQAQQEPPHPWARDPDVPLVLAAGRLHRQKDFATLIGAFALLRSRRDARLVILGEGRERRRLERLGHRLGIMESLHMPGFDPNPWAWMARASLFVLCSRLEGFGHVLVEALACGCAVVATDCPGAPAEILDNGRFGQLVPVGDAGALARAMEAGLDHPPDRQRLRQRAESVAAKDTVGSYLAVMLDGDSDGIEGKSGIRTRA